MRRVITILAVVLALAPAWSAAPARADSTEFFFYSPEFGPRDLSALTEAAEDYFDAAGVDIDFQPFARFEDFRREFEARKPAFAVAPHWLVDAVCLESTFLPLALPLRGGQSVGRKSLMAGRGIVDISDLGNGSVAATTPSVGAGKGSGALARLRTEHPSIRVISVPKDIDALLAVGFGQVQAAFVSSAQFGLLAAVNPKLTADLHEIGYSEEIPFPRLYATSYATAADIVRFRAILPTMNETGKGKRLTGLLGYDRWQPVDPSETGSPAPPAACGSAEGAPR